MRLVLGTTMLPWRPAWQTWQTGKSYYSEFARGYLLVKKWTRLGLRASFGEVFFFFSSRTAKLLRRRQAPMIRLATSPRQGLPNSHQCQALGDVPKREQKLLEAGVGIVVSLSSRVRQDSDAAEQDVGASAEAGQLSAMVLPGCQVCVSAVFCLRYGVVLF